MSAQPEQRTDAWFAQRKGRITGSRVGAILGCNPWQKPDDVMRDMVREWYGAPPEFTGNVATEYGTEHEEDARLAYEFETGRDVNLVGLIVHDEHDWLAASPDGLVEADGSVEFKCPYSGLHREVAPHYYHQTQLVMVSADRRWCDFFEWSPDETWLQRIDRDPEWLQNHMADLRAFMDEFYRIANDPKAAVPYLEDKVIERSDADFIHAAEQWKQAHASLKAAQDVEKAAREAVIELAGGKTSEGAGIRVIRTERAGSVDYKAIPQLENVDLEQYRKPSSEYFQIRKVK